MEKGSTVDSLLTLLMFVPALIFWGWCFSTAWGWFVVPYLGAPSITVGQAAGLSCVLNLMRGVSNDQKDERPYSARILGVCFGYLIILGLGWAVNAIVNR